jgi:hypothetical protein
VQRFDVALVQIAVDLVEREDVDGVAFAFAGHWDAVDLEGARSAAEQVQREVSEAVGRKLFQQLVVVEARIADLKRGPVDAE